MKTKYIVQAFVIGAVMSSSFAYAGDEKVNCRQERTGSINFYGGGWAACNAVSPSGYIRISQYVSPTNQPAVDIFENVNGLYLSCRADLPHYSTEPAYSEVCDYKPSAFVTIDNYSSGEVYVAARGADRDGTYTVKLLLDGVEQSNTSKVLDIFTGGYSIDQRVKVQAKVTDNDGYTTVKTGWAVLKFTGEINPF